MQENLLFDIYVSCVSCGHCIVLSVCVTLLQARSIHGRQTHPTHCSPPGACRTNKNVLYTVSFFYIGKRLYHVKYVRYTSSAANHWKDSVKHCSNYCKLLLLYYAVYKPQDVVIQCKWILLFCLHSHEIVLEFCILFGGLCKWISVLI